MLKFKLEATSISLTVHVRQPASACQVIGPDIVGG